LGVEYRMELLELDAKPFKTRAIEYFQSFFRVKKDETDAV
jgi:hypothetical protein